MKWNGSKSIQSSAGYPYYAPPELFISCMLEAVLLPVQQATPNSSVGTFTGGNLSAEAVCLRNKIRYSNQMGRWQNRDKFRWKFKGGPHSTGKQGGGLKFCWSGEVSREPQGPLSAEKGEALDDKIFKSFLHKFSKCLLYLIKYIPGKRKS